MDIFDLRPAEEARPLQLMNPKTGDDLMNDGKPIRVFVEGPDSPRMMAVERTIQQRRLKSAQRTGRIDLSVEEIEREALERISSAIVGWENIVTNGEPVKFSREAALKLCTELPWFRNQVDRFYRDEGNFLGAEATPPTSTTL